MAIQTLIIEDEAIVAMDLCQKLEDMGYAVTGAALTHMDAVGQANVHRPDLIVADISLADRSSGWEAVEEIRKKHGEIPVVFITGHPERFYDRLSDGRIEILQKPASDDAIKRAIRTVLARAKELDGAR